MEWEGEALLDCCCWGFRWRCSSNLQYLELQPPRALSSCSHTPSRKLLDRKLLCLSRKLLFLRGVTVFFCFFVRMKLLLTLLPLFFMFCLLSGSAVASQPNPLGLAEQWVWPKPSSLDVHGDTTLTLSPSFTITNQGKSDPVVAEAIQRATDRIKKTRLVRF